MQQVVQHMSTWQAVVEVMTAGDRARSVISTSWRKPNARSCSMVHRPAG